VLARDAFPHTSTATYGLAEGATACSNPSSSGVSMAPASISKTINNSPPTGPGRNGQWIPGDIVQYRLELQVPSQDLDDVVMTDFFPIPIHDITTIDPTFGNDVSYDGSSC